LANDAVVFCGEAAIPTGVGITAEGDEFVGAEEANLDTVGKDDAEEAGEFPGGDGVDVDAVEEDLAGERRLHGAKSAQEGGLAGAIGAEQTDEAALGEMEVQISGDGMTGIADGE
jgi:hypothetical protein